MANRQRAVATVRHRSVRRSDEEKIVAPLVAWTAAGEEEREK
jgi:hypothetical protein